MIYILLPAYNEEKSFKNLFAKLDNHFKNELHQSYHIVACNDGSTDRTGEILDSYLDKLPLTILTHKINRGLGETIRDLFEYAAEVSNEEDIIIRMDCDDTHEPQFMNGLIEKIESGCDVVIASRFVEGGGTTGLSSYRHYISMAAQLFMKFFFPIKGIREYSSGFRAYRASIIKTAISFYGNSFISLTSIGFACTLEKIVKLRLIEARFGEAPMILKYDQKVSDSKMVSSITTFGYLLLVFLYYWPWGGWRNQYKKKFKMIKQ